MSRRYVYPTSYLIIILRFLKWRRERYGNESKCFTYEGIFNWIRRESMYSDIARTTIERVIRRLAEDGYLQRVRERPRAMFCVNEERIRSLLKQFENTYDVDWEVME